MSTTVSSGQVLSGGTVSSSVNVLAGGSVVGETIGFAGNVNVSSGATASGEVVSGGNLNVASGGFASGTVASNGFFNLSSGATASATTATGAFDFVGGTDYGATVKGGFFEVQAGGQAISSVIQDGFVFVSGGGTLQSPTVQGGPPIVLRAGGQIRNATLVPGAAVNFADVPFASGETAAFDPSNGTLSIVAAGGSVLASITLAGSYAGDNLVFSAVTAGATNGSVQVAVRSNTAGGGGAPTFTNTVTVPNGGSVTVTTPGTPVGVANGGPGGFSTLSVGAGGATVSGRAGSAVLANPGLVTLFTPVAGVVAPIATSSPFQTGLLQSILGLGPATTSQTVYLPNQGLPVSIALSTQVLFDLPGRPDTIAGDAAVPVADVVLDNPGASYTTGATAASFVVTGDGAPATIINNGASDALIAATGSGGNTLEGLAGANQFITGSGGQDAVLLDGVANSLTTNGADAVLVGGPSTVTAAASGLDLVAMTAGTTLTFVNQTALPAADSITGAAGATVVVAGAGSALINAGAGPESFIVDTSAGNTTLNGAAGGGDTFLFVKDADNGSARVVVNTYAVGDTLAIHGYASYGITAGAAGAVLSLEDGSVITLTGVTAGAVQQALRQV